MRLPRRHVRRRVGVLLGLAAGGVFVTGSSALANTPVGYTVEYALNSQDAIEPVQLVATPDGSIWFSAYALGTIGRFHLPSTLNQFPIPSTTSRPSSMTLGPDGNIWFAETSYDHIGRVSTNSKCYGNITEFTIPGAKGGGISGLAAAPHDTLWLSAAGGDMVASLNLKDPSIPDACATSNQSSPPPVVLSVAPSGPLTEYPLTSQSGPNGITVDASGNVWIAESSSSKVARLDPTTGHVDEWATPTSQANVVGIAAGAGNRVWFTETDANRVGEISTIATAGDAHAITEHVVPLANSGPTGITPAPDGAMWFAESTSSGVIGRISSSGAITQFATPAVGGALIYDVTPASNGSLWYTNFAADTLGTLTTGVAPARVAAHGTAPSLASWPCVPAVWGTTPLTAATTWVRDNRVLNSQTVRLTLADLGHTYTCRSVATLPGLMQSFKSSTSFRVDSLLTRSSYSARRGATVNIDVASVKSRTVRVTIARAGVSRPVVSVSVALKRGTTRTALPLRTTSVSLARGSYVLVLTDVNGVPLATAPLTIK